MHGEGIDRYEAQSIAESAAHSIAGDVKREVGYDVTRLEQRCDDLRREIDGEAEQRHGGMREVWDAIEALTEELREVRRLAGSGGHQHPELTP